MIEYLHSVEKCLKWIEKNMLTYDRGRWGVYERIRTDLDLRVCLCRPDVASEYLRVLLKYNRIARSDQYDDCFSKVSEWLIYAQDEKGFFLFYMTDGNKDLAVSDLIYPNDNGKVLLNLCHLYEETGDVRFLDAAKKCGDFWVKIQRKRGNYYHRRLHLNKKYTFAPCFLLWMTAGLFSLGKTSGEEKYTRSAYRAYGLLKTMMGDRVSTSYEKTGEEAWRPVSSENYIALLCLSVAYECTGDEDFANALKRLKPFCLSLLTPEGAIKNGTKETKKTSLNNRQDLTDFVYTMGFAICALPRLYDLFGDDEYLSAAVKVSRFIADVQLSSGDERTDGAWCGSYNVHTKLPEGRCDQNNSLDEGGQYSLYTGWCALPLSLGLLTLFSLLKK